jgi:CheY-like chemotaxis protein
MLYVLIVDDELDSSEFVSEFLQLSGFRTRTVTCGKDAIESMLRDSPDAVILDVRMPDMDGISLLQILRSYQRWYDMPVVLLTANAGEGDEWKARELGVKRIFRKSKFELKELLQYLQEVTLPPPSYGVGNALQH